VNKSVLAVAGMAAALMAGAPALALPATPLAPHIQSLAEAYAQDGADYARRHNVTQDEAVRRLAAQEASVAATDEIAAAYADRLAGIAIRHAPDFALEVLLTGDVLVPDMVIAAAGSDVPVRFRTGARLTRQQAVEAIRRSRAELTALLPRGAGIGYDQATGEIVQMARAADVARAGGAAALRARIEALTGAAVRLRIVDAADADAAPAGAGIHGGARVSGIEPLSGVRQACTTGFLVTDGTRTAILTAAHCPDQLDHVGADGRRVPLVFVGKWGARHQDVQVLEIASAARPLFFADTAKTQLRPVNSWRRRDSTRAGDTVCRRGETTGYSCAEVELTDYAPGGALCGGPCDPAWTTVAGPMCRGGDSGGPIFLATTAFGIVKGSNYAPAGGACLFSFYMSIDYLPDGWRLLYE
jgi:streptogrisin C